VVYEATRNDNGTWTIHDVPIFGAIPKGERGNQVEIGVEWMQQAIATAAMREKDGYLPPLHVNHHGFLDQTRLAGHFRLTRVGVIRYEGKPLDVLFADLIVIDEVFREIADDKLPYRSAEIHDWSKPEINSLALLDDEVPFFRFPMLRVREEDAAAAKMERLDGAGARRGLLVAGTGGAALFCFRDSGKRRIRSKFVDSVPTGTPDQKLDRILALLERISSKIEASKPDEETPESTEEKVESPVPAEPGVKEMTNKSENQPVFSEDASEIARLTARLDAVESKQAERDRQDAIAKLAASARAKLIADGWHVDEKMEERLHTFAAQGEPVLSAYIEEVRARVPKEPPREGYLLDSLPADPPEVAKYAALGPREAELARKFAADYDRGAKKGWFAKSMTRERYIEIQMAVAARSAEKEAV